MTEKSYLKDAGIRAINPEFVRARKRYEKEIKKSRSQQKPLVGCDVEAYHKALRAIGITDAQTLKEKAGIDNERTARRQYEKPDYVTGTTLDALRPFLRKEVDDINSELDRLFKERLEARLKLTSEQMDKLLDNPKEPELWRRKDKFIRDTAPLIAEYPEYHEAARDEFHCRLLVDGYKLLRDDPSNRAYLLQTLSLLLYQETRRSHDALSGSLNYEKAAEIHVEELKKDYGLYGLEYLPESIEEANKDLEEARAETEAARELLGQCNLNSILLNAAITSFDKDNPPTTKTYIGMLTQCITGEIANMNTTDEGDERALQEYVSNRR